MNNIENKFIKLPFHIKEKLKMSANYHLKANTLDSYLIEYFEKNNMYNEIKDIYKDLIINSNNPYLFINKIDNKTN